MKRSSCHLIIFLVTLAFHSSFAQGRESVPLKLKTYTKAADYPFLFYAPPDANPENRLPFIIFLHGRSLSGSDLSRVRRYGVLDALERGCKINAFVAAPQVVPGQFWKPDKVRSVLDFVQANYPIDTTRIYVVGMSLGGYGTLNFAGKYADRIAAAVALCGGGDVRDACTLAKTNLWIKHGKQDAAVPYTESTKVYDAIKKCAPDAPTYLTLYDKLGHSQLAREFYTDTLYNWMFQFKRGSASGN